MPRTIAVGRATAVSRAKAVSRAIAVGRAIASGAGGGDVASIVSLDKDIVSTAGGDTVVVTTTGLSGSPVVTIGGNVVANPVYNSPSANKITCVTPAHAAGVVAVQVGTKTLAADATGGFTSGLEYFPAKSTTFAVEPFETPFNGGLYSGSLTVSASAGAFGGDETTIVAPGGSLHSNHIGLTTAVDGALFQWAKTLADNRPKLEANGVMIVWDVLVTTATIDGLLGAQQQMKMHLFRLTSGNGQPGWGMLGVGSGFGGRNLRLMRDFDTSVLFTTVFDPSNQWGRIRLNYNRKGGTGTVRFWLNEKHQITHSNAGIGSDVDADIYQVQGIGTPYVNPGGLTVTVEQYLDNALIANGF